MANSPGPRRKNHFRWTKRTALAAALLADGKMTNEAVAAKVKRTPSWLYELKNTPAFIEGVDALVDEFQEAIKVLWIADRFNRVEALNDMAARVLRVIDARSKDPEFKHVPGWETGILTRELKSNGGFGPASLIEQYRVDTATLAEFRAILDQAAAETGQKRRPRGEPGEDDGSGVTINAGQAVVLIRDGMEVFER